MEKKKGRLIVLSGPSGVGKGTVRNALMEDPDLNLFFSVSMTTRAPRKGEMDGREYYFVTREQFEANIQKGNFLEWAEFVGNYYGTPKDKVEAMLEQGKNVLLEIEVQGAKQVMTNCPSCVSIYLMPPDFAALEERIRSRCTEPEDVIQRRLAKAKSEMEQGKTYGHMVCNKTVDVAAKEIANIIKGA